jgi:glycine dehydrogenase subunit 1
MGRTGLKQVALLSAEKAQQTAAAIGALDGYELYFPGPFVREFCVRTPVPAEEIVRAMLRYDVLAGIDAGRWYPELKNCLIVATTEKQTEAQVKTLVAGLAEVSA